MEMVGQAVWCRGKSESYKRGARVCGEIPVRSIASSLWRHYRSLPHCSAVLFEHIPLLAGSVAHLNHRAGEVDEVPPYEEAG